ncbi:porin [Billgrantia diversa]|uniref:porin n=1 Tax=Halomonas sp. MCCC 1A13316 TaxID=2733487 RepID=UPI0018A4089D|nr:porin [Halomonas sp. MCCC 1A13316]QOR39671.1 porin [Halomonas sp. MCCC 1A13316]
MKKTLLATAIAGALGASAAAQAATVYDQDGTQLIVNGRIAMGIAGGGPEYDTVTENGATAEVRRDNGAEFVDVYSRLGISMSHQVNSDLKAFGRVEWRFTGDERNTDNGFNEVRHSYIGLESASFGTVLAGNYDSFYNSHVSAPFDVYIDRGLELTNGRGGSAQARGDSVGYITPNLSGFQAFLSAKHFSERGTVLESDNVAVAPVEDGDEEIVTQGGVKYETGPLRLALGYVDDDAIGGGNDEMLYGATASYAITDAFSARLGYETRDDNDTLGGGYDTWGLGATYAMGQWAFNADVYGVDEDSEDDTRTAWAAGAYYKLTSNFDMFLELHQADQADITLSTDEGVDIADVEGDDVYWLTGARYHF